MDTFLIIDGNWLSCRAAFVPIYLSNNHGKETGGTYRLISMFDNILKTIKPTHLLVAFDIKGENFRKKINPQYKANRNYENKEDIYKQNDEIKKILSCIGAKFVSISGYEADDVIGTYSRISKAEKTYILSGDKDVFQLIDKKTSVIFPKVGVTEFKVIDEDVFFKEYGITVNKFIDFKTLMGDESDNISGVAGCGFKTASRLLQKYGSVESLMDNSEELTGKLKQNIINWKDKYEKSKKIFSIVRDLETPYCYEDCKVNLNWKNAENIFFELDFFSFIKKLKGGKFYNVKQ
jgi:DNA polymerase-1